MNIKLTKYKPCSSCGAPGGTTHYCRRTRNLSGFSEPKLPVGISLPVRSLYPYPSGSLIPTNPMPACKDSGFLEANVDGVFIKIKRDKASFELAREVLKLLEKQLPKIKK